MTERARHIAELDPHEYNDLVTIFMARADVVNFDAATQDLILDWASIAISQEADAGGVVPADILTNAAQVNAIIDQAIAGFATSAADPGLPNPQYPRPSLRNRMLYARRRMTGRIGLGAGAAAGGWRNLGAGFAANAADRAEEDANLEMVREAVADRAQPLIDNYLANDAWAMNAVILLRELRQGVTPAGWPTHFSPRKLGSIANRALASMGANQAEVQQFNTSNPEQALAQFFVREFFTTNLQDMEQLLGLDDAAFATELENRMSLIIARLNREVTELQNEQDAVSRTRAGVGRVFNAAVANPIRQWNMDRNEQKRLDRDYRFSPAGQDEIRKERSDDRRREQAKKLAKFRKGMQRDDAKLTAKIEREKAGAAAANTRKQTTLESDLRRKEAKAEAGRELDKINREHKNAERALRNEERRKIRELKMGWALDQRKGKFDLKMKEKEASLDLKIDAKKADLALRTKRGEMLLDHEAQVLAAQREVFKAQAAANPEAARRQMEAAADQPFNPGGFWGNVLKYNPIITGPAYWLGYRGLYRGIGKGYLFERDNMFGSSALGRTGIATLRAAAWATAVPTWGTSLMLVEGANAIGKYLRRPKAPAPAPDPRVPFNYGPVKTGSWALANVATLGTPEVGRRLWGWWRKPKKED